MNIAFLNELRRREAEDILERYGDLIRGKRVLEIGGGTGAQAEVLAESAAELVSLEIAESNYRERANHLIALYDGHSIPFPDASFDVVYSSNVLEHVAHRDAFQAELARVLRPGGYAIHSMPTHWWKLRDMLENALLSPLRLAGMGYKRLRRRPLPDYGGPVDFFLGSRHGEFGDTLTELGHFMPRTWLGHFRRQGWQVVKAHGGGLFYTGRLWGARRLPWSVRRSLARVLGSSVHVYVVRKSYT